MFVPVKHALQGNKKGRIHNAQRVHMEIKTRFMYVSFHLTMQHQLIFIYNASRKTRPLLA
jgi:hypothetical protein